ncbi:MAG: DPP IV N-terminal domain-containing protein [Bacteroidales bacterium]
MIRKIFIKLLPVLLLLCSFQLTAQKKELKLIDAFKGSSYPEQLSNTAWRPGTAKFTYSEDDVFLQIDVKNNNETEVILSLTGLNELLNELSMDSAKKLPPVKWLNNDALYFTHDHQYLIYHVADNSLKSIFTYNEKAENKDFHNDSKLLAYTIDNTLYLAGENKEQEIATDSNEAIVYGQEVHRREFGISKGTFWSPAGDKLAFYRKDETMVSDYPLINTDTRIASVDNIKYPMAGEKSHHVTLGVYNVNTEDIVYMKTGKPEDQYLTNICWGPEGETIYITLLNREQNHLKLNAYNAENGQFIKTLLEEKHEKYVEPEKPPVFLPWDKEKFLWYSKRDGFNHLYLYNTDGKMIRQISRGDYEVIDIEGLNKKEKTVYLTTTEESPIERHLYAQRISKNNTKKITKKEGTHKVTLNDEGMFFLDKFSDITTGSHYSIRETKNNNTLHTLVEANNPLSENYNIGETSIFTIKAADEKTDLYCRLIKPQDFDETKQYPVIVYVYGGPHSQMIQNTWLGSSDVFLNYLANKGHLVFTIDNRGTAYRGFAFENIIHRNLGDIEVADQMEGVNYLKQLPYVDSSRIGVHGWSYGGYMTIAMLLKHPETFSSGVAGGPVTDWKYYEVMYGERYMGTPQNNPEGYESASLLEKTHNLNSRLLIIHGTKDPVVVWQHSLQFLDEAINSRKLTDYFVYPGHEHGISGIDRLHLYMKIEQYFDDHL